VSKASENRFFGTGYHDYGTPSWSAEFMRYMVRPESGWELWQGLAWATLYAVLSVWVGLLLGDWMRKIQR
jgi:hypothetical protein